MHKNHHINLKLFSTSFYRTYNFVSVLYLFALIMLITVCLNEY
jgi:hypothetical protein